MVIVSSKQRDMKMNVSPLFFKPNIRLKKKKSMSQSLWQIERPDLNAFMFLFCFVFLSSRRVKFESFTTLL